MTADRETRHPEVSPLGGLERGEESRHKKKIRPDDKPLYIYIYNTYLIINPSRHETRDECSLQATHSIANRSFSFCVEILKYSRARWLTTQKSTLPTVNFVHLAIIYPYLLTHLFVLSLVVPFWFLDSLVGSVPELVPFRPEWILIFSFQFPVLRLPCSPQLLALALSSQPTVTVKPHANPVRSSIVFLCFYIHFDVPHSLVVKAFSPFSPLSRGTHTLYGLVFITITPSRRLHPHSDHRVLIQNSRTVRRFETSDLHISPELHTLPLFAHPRRACHHTP